jgi:hypothetical protein
MGSTCTHAGVIRRISNDGAFLAVHGFPTVDMRADDDADGMLL